MTISLTHRTSRTTLSRSLLLALLVWAVLLPAGAHAQTLDVAWYRSPTGPTSDDREEATGIATDASGNVYATGRFERGADFDGDGRLDAEQPGDFSAAFLAKYDPAGGLLWVLPIVADVFAAGLDVAVDAAGNPIVTGVFADAVDFDDDGVMDETVELWDAMFVAKYSPSGEYLWSRIGDGRGYEKGQALAVDGSGIYVIGETGSPADFDGDGTGDIPDPGTDGLFLVKYDHDGGLEWVHGVSGTPDATPDVTVHGGNVYATGHFWGSQDFDSDGVADATAPGEHRAALFVAVYDGDGALQWVREAGADFSTVSGSGIAVGDGGRVFVTGTTGDEADFDGDGIDDVTTTSFSALFVAAYDAAGVLQWLDTRGDRSPSAWYGPGDIAIDDTGTLHILAHDDYNDDELLLTSYTAAGMLLSTQSLPGTLADESPAGGRAAIHIDSENLYLAASFHQEVDLDGDGDPEAFGTGGSADALVVQYGPTDPTNGAPDAVADDVSTPEDTPVAIDVLANDDDPDGDALSVWSISQPWNQLPVVFHRVTLEADGTLLFTPQADFTGIADFAYVVTDGRGGFDAAEIEVTVTERNDPPVAVDDTFTVDEGESTRLDVLANDTDADEDPLTFDRIDGPEHGTAEPDGDAIVYTPEVGYLGTDRFTYTITDGQETSTATVVLTVGELNEPPIATDDAVLTEPSQPVTVDVLANDDDPDGTTLTVTGASASNYGSTEATGGGVTYTPGHHYGRDRFTYTVEDERGGTDEGEVTVTLGSAAGLPLGLGGEAWLRYVDGIPERTHVTAAHEEGVYFTGHFSGGLDLDNDTDDDLTAPGPDRTGFVASYDEDGAFLWAVPFGGGATIRATAAGAGGTVYVAGEFGGDIDFDRDGNVDATASDDGGFFAARIGAGGIEWSTFARAGWIVVDGLAVAPDGGLYVLGGFGFGTADFNGAAAGGRVRTPGNEDIYVVKYTADGAFEWVVGTRGLSEEGLARAGAIDVDANGATITGTWVKLLELGGAGSIVNPGVWGDPPGHFLAHARDGDFTWVVGVPRPEDVYFTDVAVDDATGTTFLVGRFSGSVDLGDTDAPDVTSAGEEDLFVAAYDAAGTLLWTRSGGGAGDDAAQHAALVDGALYVGGESGGGVSFVDDADADLAGDGAFLARYRTDGTFVGAESAAYPLPPVGPDGDVFVSGSIDETLLHDRYSRADADRDGSDDVVGTGLYVARLSAPRIPDAPAASCPAALKLVAFDADQGADDTGEFVELENTGSGAASHDACALVFYDGSTERSYYAADLGGTVEAGARWRIGNPGVEDVEQTFPPNTLQDGPDAIALYDAPAESFPGGTALTFDGLLSAIVYASDDMIVGASKNGIASSETPTETPADMLGRLAELVEAADSEPDLPAEYALGANYPNPFNPETAIPFALPEAQHVRLTVYDALGRQVVRLLDAPMEAGHHQVRWEAGRLPSGLYLYRLEAGAFHASGRMTLLK